MNTTATAKHTATNPAHSAPLTNWEGKPMPTKPILEPRMQLGLDQLKEVQLDLESAIAWADKPFNRDAPGGPAIVGRRVREMLKLIEAATKNLTPAPANTIPVIIERYKQELRQEVHDKQQASLALNVPMQSRPAFANKAGAR